MSVQLTPPRDSVVRHGPGPITSDVRRIAVDPEPFSINGFAEHNGMDLWLDNLETIATAISQRRLTDDQRERLYGLLERVYADARERKR